MYIYAITDTGNFDQITEIGASKKSLQNSASKVYIEELSEDFVQHHIFPEL